MEITIVLAREGQARDCLSCIKHSDLWDAYFDGNEAAEQDINTMIANKQIYVALDRNQQCVGFMGVIHNGCFRKFSYLALIAVLDTYRGNGIGKKLLRKYEQEGFEQADKVFLVVSDFNRHAYSLYQRFGYTGVGNIPDLFKKGVTERIMVKYKHTAL